jgi:hypothetical protein
VPYSQQQIEDISAHITPLLGDELTWRWEDRFSVMLSEFSRNKKDKTLEALRQEFEHEWDKKSIKKAPKELKEQLGQLTKLSKDQLILARPATDIFPAMIALWWPWGHGGTYSLRIVPLSYPYDFKEETNQTFFSRLKHMFS